MDREKAIDEAKFSSGELREALVERHSEETQRETGTRACCHRGSWRSWIKCSDSTDADRGRTSAPFGF